MENQNYEENAYDSENTEYYSVLDDPQTLRNDILYLLSTTQGRRFIRRIFRICGLMDGVPVNSLEACSWHEGRREVARGLYACILQLGTHFIAQILQEDAQNI